MKALLVSVIIPVYNAGKYLRQCVESVLTQTLSSFELIMVDDGSTDDSNLIIKEYAARDGRVRAISFDKSSGSGARPRNEGLKRARGKYVVFLDADDFFSETLLEKLVARADDTHADIVLCDSFNYYDDQNEASTISTELHREFLPEQTVFSYKDIPDCIFQISNAAVWHRLFLKKFLENEEITFQENVPILDDVYFVNATLVAARRIAVIPDRLVYYRRDREGGQTSAVDKHFSSIYDCFHKLNEYLLEVGIYEEIKTSLQIWTLNTMRWWITRIGDKGAYDNALKLYKERYMTDLMLNDARLSRSVPPYVKQFRDQAMSETVPLPVQCYIRFNRGGKKAVVLYGAGHEGERAYRLISNSQNISLVLWCDRNAAEMDRLEVASPEEIRRVKAYDNALIAINNPIVVEEAARLLAKFGAPPECIIPVIT